MPVTLDANLSNLRSYVDNLFDSQVRTAPSTLVDLDPAGGPAYHWFNDTNGCMAHLVSAFFNLMKDGFDDATRWNVPSDMCLTRFMYPQLKKLSMFVPALHRTGTYKHLEGWRPFRKEYTSPVYRIDGYKRYPLAGDAGLRLFVQLFLAGAHFVVLHNKKDVKGHVKDFYKEFESDQRLVSHRFTPEHTETEMAVSMWDVDTEVTVEAQMTGEDNRTTATGHSHYTSTVALGTAFAFPVIKEDKAPIRCPMVASLIVDTTDWKRNNDYNTFFQLEGWPGVVRGGAGGRHAADFETHQATKWNIATYGLCPYSEKRGTTIFLAPDDWKALVQAGWSMPSYAGARTRTPGWVATASFTANAGGVLNPPASSEEQIEQESSE